MILSGLSMSSPAPLRRDPTCCCPVWFQGWKLGPVERVLEEQLEREYAFAQWCSDQSASGGMVLSSRPAFRAGFVMPLTVADLLFA